MSSGVESAGGAAVTSPGAPPKNACKSPLLSAIGIATPITGALSHLMVTKHTVGGAGLLTPGLP